MFGGVSVEYRGVRVTRPVFHPTGSHRDGRRSIKVALFVLWDDTMGLTLQADQAAIASWIIRKDMRAVRAQYAQFGIYPTVVKVPNTKSLTVDGEDVHFVDLSKAPWLLPTSVVNDRMGPPASPNSSPSVISDLNSMLPNPGAKVLKIAYVRNFVSGTNGFAQNGVNVNALHDLVKNNGTESSASHELTHLLVTAKSHYPDQVPAGSRRFPEMHILADGTVALRYTSTIVRCGAIWDAPDADGFNWYEAARSGDYVIR